jgi:serine/threonine protein phosphatase PrpC
MAISSTATSTFDLALLRCAAGTDVGMRREENQDSFGVIRHETFHAYFVADGMGGAQGGATASRMAIAILQETLSEPNTRVSPSMITEAVEKMNRKIFEKGSTEPAYAGMGTTLVGLVFTPDGLLGVNVGDSRAYRVRGSLITQISQDHTVVRELVESGALAAEDAHEHPVSHMLTRSLGPLADVEVECKMVPELPTAGDIYVLCSDGLYNYVPEEDILAVVRQNPIDDANQILINLANQRGGADNITVLVIAVGDKAPRGRKNTIPPVALESDLDHESSPNQIVPANSALLEPPIIPPSVQEPSDPKAKSKALRESRRATITGTRTVPMAMALGITLVIGLILGNFARRTYMMGSDAWDFVRGSVFPGDSEPPTEDQQMAPGQNPLAALAKQIQAERGETGSVLAGVPSELKRQPALLERSIQRLEAQIRELSTTAVETGPQNLDSARQRLSQIESEYAAIEANLDVASRAVTLWLGRQVAFEGQEDFFESSSDVQQFGAYSNPVKEKLALITSLAYQYREKADDVELHPEDSGLRGELEAIQKRREQIRRELTQEIRKVINSSLSKSYREYESLKIQRDLLWLDVQGAKEELEVQRSLSNSDLLVREKLKLTLEERLQNERQMLEELRTNPRSVGR